MAQVSADQLFGGSSTPKAPPTSPGGVSADSLFGGAPSQAPPTAPVQPKPPVAPPQAPPAAPQSGFSATGGPAGPRPVAQLTPEEKRAPVWSGVQKSLGLDPDKIHSYTKDSTKVLEGSKELMVGFDNWLDSINKKNGGRNVIAPIDALAKGVEFHIMGHDPFNLKGTVTPIDEIVSGIENKDDTMTKNGAGRLLGIIGAMMAPDKVKDVGDFAKDVKASYPKEAVVAAVNDTLDKTSKAANQTIVDSIKKTRASNGALEQKISGADRALTQATQKPTVSVFDLGNKIATKVAEVSKNNTSPVDLPQTKTVVKWIQGRGQSLSFEDLKDLGSQINAAQQNAVGKDSAVLGDLAKQVGDLKAARAKQLGLEPEYSQYTQSTKELTEHGKGIVKELANAKTGLDWQKVISKPSNAPSLTALTKTLGLPKDFFSSIADSHKPLADLAKSNEGGGNVSRFAAVMKHPVVAGGAMAGAAVGTSLLQLPLSVRFVASLFAAAKAADLMDRVKAVGRMREMGGNPLSYAPPQAPSQQPTTSGAPGTPPASGSPPQGAPPVTPGPGTPPGGAPVNPVVARIQALLDPNASFKTAVAKGETDIADMKAERDARLEKIAPTLKQGSNLVDPTTFDKGYKTETKGGEASGKENVKEGTSESKEGQNVPKEKGQKVAAKAQAPKPYEKFGVVVDKTKWTTPEEVAKGKADAKLALQDGVNKRAGEIREGIKNGTIDKASATKQVQELVADQKKAVASIDKIKTPEVGRAARDRIRKGGEAFDALADVGKQQAEREQLSGEVQQDIDAGIDIERLDKLLRDAGFGSLVDKITKAHTEKYDTEYPLLAKQLQAAYDAVSKKK